MRALAWGAVLLTAGVLSGCRLDWPLLKHDKPVPAPAPAPAPPPPPPVQAEQVTEANARDLAQALEEEIARDEQGPLRAPAGPGTKPN